jgi:hypothetical protein
VLDLRQTAFTLLHAEITGEAASGFPRLRRIPHTDVIWFLDYFDGLTEAEREALLGGLAESAAAVFALPPSMTFQVPAALARMCEERNRPGAKGGTRYTDTKQLTVIPALREPGGYHESWREHLTALHFQPRPDLVPDLADLKAAKAPLVRKLVTAALRDSLGLRKEKLPRGVSTYTGKFGDGELTVDVEFESMLHQLGYLVRYKTAGSRPLILLLCYERLWGTTSRWDYLTEENAPRSIAFLAEQIAYLAKLGARING